MNAFDKRIRDLVNFAYTHAPAIRKQLDSAGVTPDTIQTAADLAQVPVLSKDELVEIHHQHPPFGGFLTVDPDTLARIYISPGPIYDPQPPAEDPQSLLEPFRYVGFGRGDRVLNTFSYHLTPAGMLLDEALRSCGATVIPTGPGNTDLQIHLAVALRASGFVGQPSYLMTILDQVEAQGICPQEFPVKKALFSAELYTPSQQDRFENEWGIKTTSAFGTADLGLIGYSLHGVPGFKILPKVFIQIVGPESGEDLAAGDIGEIVVTTFNKAYPLIRFGTGDLGALAPDLLDGNQHLIGLYGRSGEAIKVRGMFLHPKQLQTAMQKFPIIQQAQAIITRPNNRDVVTLRVKLKQDSIVTEDIIDKIKAMVQSAVRLRIDHVEFVDVIERGARMVSDERDWS